MVAVTSASEMDSYIRCAARASGSSTWTTSLAAEACWLTIQPPSTPHATDSSTRPALSIQSLAGIVAATDRLAIS